ncbi:MAG: hypothetical protein ACPG5T_01260 [Endozoicomonas sp.]
MEAYSIPGYNSADPTYQFSNMEKVKAPKPSVYRNIHITSSADELIEDLDIEDSIAMKIAGRTIRAQIRFPRRNFRIALIEGACLTPKHFKMRKTK